MALSNRFAVLNRNLAEKYFMLTDEFFKKWYAAFAQKVDPFIMSERVKAHDCCPWHIFTWGKVECLRGEDAISAYKNLPDEEIYCYVGYDYAEGWVEKRKNDLSEIICDTAPGDEIYITALDFSWTFVQTHEEFFGPYFLKR